MQSYCFCLYERFQGSRKTINRRVARLTGHHAKDIVDLFGRIYLLDLEVGC